MSQIQKTCPNVEEIAQEVEILLSQDFSAMTLEEITKAEAEYISFVQAQPGRVEWTKEQYKAWQFMYHIKKKREHEAETVKIGDLFYSSWGYEQTNSEFFKVVEISKTGKTCKIVQVRSEFIGDEAEINRAMAGQIIAVPDSIYDKKPSLQVKIERSTSFNPYTKKHEQVGAICLRGSVYYGTSEDSTNKHLESLYRVTGPVSVSWYA